MSMYKANDQGEIEMPTTDEIAKQLMAMFELVELAETGHRESMEQCVVFMKMSLMQSASMLEDPGLQAAVKRAIERETGKPVIDAPAEG